MGLSPSPGPYNMSVAFSPQCETPILVFNDTIWNSTRFLIQENAMDAVLPCTLYGTDIFILP